MDIKLAQEYLDNLKKFIGEVEYKESVSSISNDELSEFIFEEYPQLQDGYKAIKEAEDPELSKILEEYSQLFSKYEQTYIYNEDLNRLNENNDVLIEWAYNRYQDDASNFPPFKDYGYIGEYAEFKTAIENIPESIWNTVKDDFEKNIKKGMLIEDSFTDALKEHWDDIRVCVLAKDLAIKAETNRDFFEKKVDNGSYEIMDTYDLTTEISYENMENDYNIIIKSHMKTLNSISRFGISENSDVRDFINDKIDKAFKDIEFIEDKTYNIITTRNDIVTNALLHLERSKELPTLIEMLMNNPSKKYEEQWRAYRENRHLIFTDESVLFKETKEMVSKLPDRVLQNLAIANQKDDNGLAFKQAINEIRDELIVSMSCDKQIARFNKLIDALQNENITPAMNKAELQSEKQFYSNIIRDKAIVKDNPYLKNPDNCSKWLSNILLMKSYLADKVNECDKLLQRLETNVIERKAQDNLKPSNLHPETIRIVSSLEYCINKYKEFTANNPEGFTDWKKHFDEIKETSIEAMAMIEYERENNPNIDATAYRDNEMAIMGLLRKCYQLANNEKMSEVTIMKDINKKAFKQENQDRYTEAMESLKDVVERD